MNQQSSRWRWVRALGRALRSVREHHQHVHVEHLPSFPSRFLGDQRAIDIFLPPGYTDGQRHYPVLYVNDGQDMAAWQLQATLERLSHRGAIEPQIVVAMHATERRLHEYGIAGNPNTQGFGDRAADYTRFVLEEVQPFINEHCRTLTGPQHTALLGASLGGLMAFDMAWQHPDCFGTVGVFSGSFWWRTDDSSPAAQQRSRIIHRLVKATHLRPHLRIWLQTGTRDEEADRDGDGVIDAIQDTTELLAAIAEKGFPPHDLYYLQVEGGEHNAMTWAKVLPDFLSWKAARSTPHSQMESF